MNELLRADAVVAGYLPGIDILRGVALTAAEGELVGIIGPNGAGKSTLLKSLFGLVQVRSGSVELRGESIVGLAAHSLVARGVGYVPQRENVFPSLTFAESGEHLFDGLAASNPLLGLQIQAHLEILFDGQ